MNVWFLGYVHLNMRGFLLVKMIKMDSLFVCDLAQIALYSSMHSRDGWIQKMLFPRNVCVCLCSWVDFCVTVNSQTAQDGNGWGEHLKLVEKQTCWLESAGSDRWAQRAAWKMDSKRSWRHSPCADRHRNSYWLLSTEMVEKNKISSTSTHTQMRTHSQRLSVSGGEVGKTPNSVSSWTEKKRGPGGPRASEKCLWARFVKTCYFDFTMFTQRNTYWESGCAGRIWNWSFIYYHQTHIPLQRLK